MFFNRKLLIDGSLRDAWRIAHRDNIPEADGEASLPELCEELLSWINSDHKGKNKRSSLRTAAFLTSGVSRLYRRKVQKAYEDMYKTNTDTSLTSDESDDETEDERIKREASLISLRKRRKPTTSDELETIRRYTTDEDGISHSSPKIRSRHLQSSDQQLSQITDKQNDESSSYGEEELVDNDEEIDDEVEPSDRNMADDYNESHNIRSNSNETSSVWTTNEALPKNVCQHNNSELKCLGNEGLIGDNIRVEGADSRNKAPTEIDDLVQLTTVRDTHEEVPGCKQAADSNDVTVARTSNDQPTGANQTNANQKSQMTQTILSSFNRPQSGVSEDSEGDNFRRDLPFGCLLVFDSYNSRVPTQIILSSLDANVKKLKKD